MTTPRDELLQRCVTWFAEHGVGDTSLRTLAAGTGTSHRMLHYHFGSREGLLAAVVQTVEQGERDVLARMLAESREKGQDPYVAGRRFWAHVADDATTFAPLFFELSGHAMQGTPWAASLREWLATGWTDALTELWMAFGHPREEAGTLARVNLAAVRGLLFDLAVTGDRKAVDEAVALLAARFGFPPAP